MMPSDSLIMDWILLSKGPGWMAKDIAYDPYGKMWCLELVRLSTTSPTCTSTRDFVGIR